ncbi:DUF389 domain-containing protein [Ilumatobacter sp.]|uniref:DUF389 domain-containing protein n=1 Tax=Ilumatobacter sp. TaxID=1967498 RepID=UPI003B52A8F2
MTFSITPPRPEGFVESLRDREATNLRSWTDGGVAYIDATVPNDAVGRILQDASDSDEHIRCTFSSQDAITMDSRSATTESLTDLSPLSPAEVYMKGEHSTGAWAGFLGYAGAAGAVVWLGLFTDSVALQIGAMLIAPFGGPAMNAAIATAHGDRPHLFENLRRYVAAIATTVVVAGVLHLVFGGEVVTSAMSATANLSREAVLLPLIGGAAGALNLMQSERSSLVSAAATGVLVAAALAPPAGLVGMAVVLGEWEMAVSGFFLLGLQLAGINLAGALVFGLYGLRPECSGLSDGRSGVRWVSLALAALVVVGLVVLQRTTSPNLERATVTQQIASTVSSVFESTDDVDLVMVDATFTRPDDPGPETVVVDVVVQILQGSAATLTEAEIGSEIEEVVEGSYDVTALVTVRAFAGGP